MDYSKVRGFNYQPSYGSSSFENWMYFNPDVIELELRRGRAYFPKMNTVRLWLAWDAFVRNPGKFARNFETALRIAASLDMMVVPVLFNRWHNGTPDCGGIYIDHFVPNWNWLYREKQFQPYIETVVGGHKDDDRILLWDICNEPFSYLKSVDDMKEIEEAEYKWLEEMYNLCKKEIKVKAPVAVSIHNWRGTQLRGCRRISPISDIIMIHPYFMYEKSDIKEYNAFVETLDGCLDVARQEGKDILVTETCWGGWSDLSDEWHVRNIGNTLAELKKRNIGWIVHALHHSLVADLHRPEYGSMGVEGYFAFIEADGTLRKGHEVFNEF